MCAKTWDCNDANPGSQTPLIEAANGKGHINAWRLEDMRKVSVPSFQLFCEPTTALKYVIYFMKKREKLPDKLVFHFLLQNWVEKIHHITHINQNCAYVEKWGKIYHVHAWKFYNISTGVWT